ncbi:MAG: 3'-5' exonuclease, partial [Cyanobacteria bacterium J06648_11]
AEADTLACWLLADMLLTELLNESETDLLARFSQQKITLSTAAKMLGCEEEAAYLLLDRASISPLYTNRRGTAFYLREAVERVCDRLSEA